MTATQEISNRAARVRARTCEPNTDHEAYELARDTQTLLRELKQVEANVALLYGQLKAARAELDRRQAVVDAAEQLVASHRIDTGTWVDTERIQGVALQRLADALEALSGEGHVCDPIECSHELTEADKPVEFGPVEQHTASVEYNEQSGSYRWVCSCGGGSLPVLPEHAAEDLARTHAEATR